MRVVVRVPATTANLGPGFDTLGLALKLHNTVDVETTPLGVEIDVTGIGSDLVPRSTNNTVYRALQAVFDRAGARRPGMKIRIHNEVPVTRGLGSSATAIVGGLVAGNALCGYRLSDDELLQMAVAIEGHPDNVAAALYGGFVVSGTVDNRVYAERFSPPSGLRLAVVIPEFPLSTVASRGVLPKMVSFRDAVANMNAVALMVTALAKKGMSLLATAMRDRLHEPYRFALIPGALKAVSAAKTAGALCVALSGSGPSIIAFGTCDMKCVADRMRDELADVGVAATTKLLIPSVIGAEVVKGPSHENGGEMMVSG